MRWWMLAGFLLATPAAASAQPPELPADIVAAWQKEGASVGWMGSTRRNFQVFSERREWLEDPAAVPAFSISNWRPGILKSIPAPAVPFGLSLRDTEMNDEGLKELAGFKHLASLSLLNTKVTDAGLGELACLKKLTALNLDGTTVSGAGLKKLAGLSRLTALGIRDRVDTDPRETVLTDGTLKSLREIGLLHALTRAESATARRPTSAEEVVSLDLSHSPVTDAGLNALSGMRNLAYLNLRDTEVTDAGMKIVAQMQRVTSLNLFETDVTAKGLKELAALKRLAMLALGGTARSDRGKSRAIPADQVATGVCDKSLEALRDMRLLHILANAGGPKGERPASVEHITSLFLAGTSVTDAGLEHLAGLKQVQSLSLRGCSVTDAGLAHLAGMSQLQSLDLHGCRLTDAGLEHLAGMTRLQSLNLDGCSLTGNGLRQLATLKQLTSLTLAPGIISDEAFTALREIGLLHSLTRAQSSDGGRPGNLAEIMSLDLSETHISDKGLKELAHLPQLASLDLSKTSQNAYLGLHELAALEHLAVLSLEGTGTGNAQLMELRSNTRLESLNLKSTRITDSGLKALVNMTELTSLNLEHTGVTDAGLKHLASLKKLTTLNLATDGKSDTFFRDPISANPIAGVFRPMDTGLRELARLKQLTALNLSGWDITDAGLKHLAGLDQLASLDVSQTFVTADGIARLRTALPNLTVRAESLRGLPFQEMPWGEENKNTLRVLGLLALFLVITQIRSFRRWRAARNQAGAGEAGLQGPNSPLAARPLALFAIAITGILAAALLGGLTNNINGLVSPLYFVTIMRWHGDDVWRAAIAQGIIEGSCVGAIFSLIFTTAVGIITRAACPYLFALRYQLRIVGGALVGWVLGGAAAMLLATLSPDFYRMAFFGVPDAFGPMLAYAWVGGSIWGVQSGGFLSMILGIISLRDRWLRSGPVR